LAAQKIIFPLNQGEESELYGEEMATSDEDGGLDVRT